MTSFYVYILSNRSGTLYTGSTRDLKRRLKQHKSREFKGFARRYRIDRLVYFEQTSSARAMAARERQIKGWNRAKKIALVESVNPTWADLSAVWE